jgi:hypothetical protein
VTPPPAQPGVLDEIRAAARAVTERAELVRLVPDGVARVVELLDAEPPRPTYPGAYFRGPDADTAAYVVTLETLNFGSGWFDHLRKRPGCSGHFTVAASLTDLALSGRLWDAPALTAVDAGECAAVFGQDPAGPVADLMALFATALNDLGRLVLDRYDGSATALVEAAGQSAERLLLLLDAMPFFRDVGELDGLTVPFYKRAQICSATLALAFDGQGLGRFGDLDRLTMFADNLVPHVLWCEGAVDLDTDLAAAIAAGDVLPTGGREEIELRAAAVDAVERIVAGLRERGRSVTAMAVDEALWARGQRPAYKARPRPRIRTTAF